MEKREKLYISLYNDYYGSLLTDYQRELIDGYYNLDMSLGELAEEHGISPQGVRDALKRAEKQLQSYEQKLSLVAKTQKVREMLEEVAEECAPEQKRKILQAIDVLVE